MILKTPFSIQGHTNVYFTTTLAHNRIHLNHHSPFYFPTGIPACRQAFNYGTQTTKCKI